MMTEMELLDTVVNQKLNTVLRYQFWLLLCQAFSVHKLNLLFSDVKCSKLLVKNDVVNYLYILNFN